MQHLRPPQRLAGRAMQSSARGLSRRLALGLLLGLAVGRCASSEPNPPGVDLAGCDLHYRVWPAYEQTPRALNVELSFAAGPRNESFIRAIPSWAGVNDFARFFGAWRAAAAHQQVLPTQEATRWRVSHRPSEPVVVRWQVRASLDQAKLGLAHDQSELYKAQLGADWFQFFGVGVLASVEHWGDNTQPTSCITLESPQAAPLFSSHGMAEQSKAVHWRIKGSPQQTRHAFYAGGTGWRLLPRSLSSGPLLMAVRGSFGHLPDSAFADASAALIDTQRRYWSADGQGEPAAFQTLVLTPNHHAGGNFGGTLVHQAAVMHVASDFQLSHPSFEFLVAHENLHQWFPHRFGSPDGNGGNPVDEVFGYWFSEGFTDFFTHRLLLASGLWTPERYAQALTQRLRSYLQSPERHLPAAQIAPVFFSDRQAGQQMYLRGEFLALRWDNALRAQGHAGLQAVMRSLMQPRQLSQPGAAKATERVLQALSPLLAPAGINPRTDVQRYILKGEAFDFGFGGLDASTQAFTQAFSGPCFKQSIQVVDVWTLGFDRASVKQGGALAGVDPQGPAYAAGLRDGMKALGFSIYFGDLSQDVLVQVHDEATGKVRDVSYRPVASTPIQQPLWQVDVSAIDTPACQRWMRAQ